MIRVYVAAPYALAPFVRDVHSQLEDIGCKPTSTWAELATGAEKLADAASRPQRVQWELNSMQLDATDVMLVISTPDAGAEMFAEVGRALFRGIPILWTGKRRILSCYAPGVVLCRTSTDVRGVMYEGLDEAMDELTKASNADSAKVLLQPRASVGPANVIIGG